MSQGETNSSAVGSLSRDDFVRQLRRKSEEAAEASVHHASLSQQYLELSQKYSQLAEQSGTEQVEDLLQSMKSLERQVPASNTTGGPRSALLAPEAQPRIAQSNQPFPDSLSPENTPVLGQSEDSPKAPPQPKLDTADKIVDQQKPAKPQSGTRRKRRISTRRLIERSRAASLMSKSRVRVKARKSDLKPRQRFATDDLKENKGSIATSTGLFAIAVFFLSLITWQLEVDVPLDPIMAAFAAEVTEIEEPQPIEPPEEEPGEQTEQEVEEPVEEEQTEEEAEPEPEEMPEEPEQQMAEAEPEAVPLPESPDGAEAADPNVTADAAAAADNRSDAGRKAMLQKYGGSQASESAVQRGLEWLASVQHRQGWWDFVNVGPSGNPGTINNPIGGTAYALLPFLAAGQTHQSGSYQKQVGAGLSYLMRIGVNAPAGYDLRGMINKNSDDDAPNEAYYVHGAATLVLCEAYGMTKDRRLKRPAEGAVRFIINSQDPRGGGWRYNPQEPGSTSVTAIQVMALMAAKKAGIKVPDNTFKGIMHYLDSVQVDKEGRYGYRLESKKYSSAITAMSLLCRMYLGWGRDDGDMRAGIALLDKAGPYDNLYSLYFATQAMKNWGGKEWERWNVRMRDDLVAFQETEGPAKGSWKPRTGAIHAKQGGRLLTTALATLTLEVYYRYKPLLPEEEAASVATAK